MKEILFLLGLVTAVYYLAVNSSGSEQYELWKSQYRPKFQGDVQNFRKQVFYNNLRMIRSHNADKTNTFRMGLSKFAALTQQEFIQLLTRSSTTPQEFIAQEINKGFQGDIDWSTKGVVTGVKDQGNCGSCWAFSATGALQALDKMTNGVLRSFSQQQLVDCSRSYGNQGCNGGQQFDGFRYVKDKGIALETAYPYTAKDGTCKSNVKTSFNIGGAQRVKGCNDIEAALQTKPLSVAVDATKWQFYQSGVFSKCKNKLNHAVLMVGTTDQYWKIKNSWGNDWGENGYIRLAKGDTCGVCEDASYPTAAA